MITWHERTIGIGVTSALELAPLFRMQSEFQEIEVYEHPLLGRVLVLDGTVQLSQADECIYHELAVHVPLLGRHRSAARVLIVGGGDGGILRECLVHPNVDRVVMVEIDRAVIDVSNEWIGIEGDYDDPRVELVVGDAFGYMAAAAARGERFDLIIMDATDSTSPSKTLQTTVFYDHLAHCLAEDGVCVDSDILIRDPRGVRFSRDPCEVSLLDLYRTRVPFRGVECYLTLMPTFPGGWFAFFLYTRDGHSCAEPVAERTRRFYTPDVHRAGFALPTWLREALHVASSSEASR